MRVAVYPENYGVYRSDSQQRAGHASVNASDAFLLHQRAEAVDGARVFWVSDVLSLEVYFYGIEGMTHDDPGTACEKYMLSYFAMEMVPWVRSAVTFY